MSENCFTIFPFAVDPAHIPSELNNPYGITVPEIGRIAALELQKFLTENDSNWTHNFGIEDSKKGIAKGKMFGVLVVQTKEHALGYLAAFSGKMFDNIHDTHFAPSVFDIASDNYFINRGMAELTEIGRQIALLGLVNNKTNQDETVRLKTHRKMRSAELQKQLFGHYYFSNPANESKNLNAIFMASENKIPPAAAGECAAPKLLQYAFENKMKPLAIAEFWWGKSNKSEGRQHGEFYPACQDKCLPILEFMLNRKLVHPF